MWTEILLEVQVIISRLSSSEAYHAYALIIIDSRI